MHLKSQHQEQLISQHFFVSYPPLWRALNDYGGLVQEDLKVTGKRLRFLLLQINSPFDFELAHHIEGHVLPLVRKYQRPYGYSAITHKLLQNAVC